MPGTIPPAHAVCAGWPPSRPVIISIRGRHETNSRSRDTGVFAARNGWSVTCCTVFDFCSLQADGHRHLHQLQQRSQLLGRWFPTTWSKRPARTSAAPSTLRATTAPGRTGIPRPPVRWRMKSLRPPTALPMAVATAAARPTARAAPSG